jgi:hypothetical protein
MSLQLNPLHLSKVAVGCASFEALRQRIESRAGDGMVAITTRFRPKRADELVGGSLYWIVKHRIIARQTILGFADGEDRRTLIRLDATLVAVRAYPKRAHQGWRYLGGADVPEDFDSGDADIGALPPALVGELSALALI